MDAVLMCGGQGTRLASDTEKPLYELAGRPMVERVLDALTASALDTIYAVTSPATPETTAHLESETHDCRVREAPGDGYVADLEHALDGVDGAVLTVTADLPLLDGDALDTVLDEYTGNSMTVCVPLSLKQRLGVNADTTFSQGDRRLAPAGVNVVAPTKPDERLTIQERRFAVNVNYQRDARVAEVFL